MEIDIVQRLHNQARDGGEITHTLLFREAAKEIISLRIERAAFEGRMIQAEKKTRDVEKEERNKTMYDEAQEVNHPKHYTSHPSGIECIQITEHMSFCLGNAVKYVWRADLKENAMQDLEKAKWYIEQEMDRRQRQCSKIV